MKKIETTVRVSRIVHDDIGFEQKKVKPALKLFRKMN